jgi:NTE family protein
VYAASVAARPAPPQATLAFVGFQGSDETSPERFVAQLESKAGDKFDPAKAERDARALAATGDYTRADYQLVNTAEGDGLVFELADKPWGPNYFHVGLDLSTDFTGRSAFNIKIAHNRHWLTPTGTEWRNRVQIGSVPTFATELYHPLGWTTALTNDWFVAGYASIERRTLSVFDPDDDVDVELARFHRTTTRAGFDLGQPWGRFGEFRFRHHLPRSRYRTRNRDRQVPRVGAALAFP